jgi:protease-4
MKNYGKFVLGLLVGAAVVVAVVGMFSLVSFGSAIAVIRIKGTISSSSSFLFETATPNEILSVIKRAEEDPGIQGVLFEIDSPGGSAVASREIAYGVKRMTKPKMCWMGDVAASGAYWVASGCDHIMADPLTLTGSIGATGSFLEFSELFKEYGITYEQITSGERKDTGTPFRNISEEEREKLQYMIDEVFSYFLNDVKESRNLSDEQVDQISSGDVFLAKDAVELGLVDSLGTIQDAKEKAREMVGDPHAEFLELKVQGFNLLDLLGIL